MGYKFNWEDAQEVARSVAIKTARAYPGIDSEDIEQAIMLRVAEQEGTFKRINYDVPALYVIFKKYARKYANDERVSAMTFSDQYHYTNKEIRALCQKALFDRDAFLHFVEDEPELMANFEDIMCRVADLQTAYDNASDTDRSIIAKRFLSEEELTPAERRASQRAINHLTVAVNSGRSKRVGRGSWNHEGPGARLAMSNARSRYITDSQMDGTTQSGFWHQQSR